jgi:hypothetical protein
VIAEHLYLSRGRLRYKNTEEAVVSGVMNLTYMD